MQWTVQARHEFILTFLGQPIANDGKQDMVSGCKLALYFLQATGLAVLMAKSGLAIPAAPPVVLPPFSNVLADIGDSQSLQSSLSTFSGHLSRIKVGFQICQSFPKIDDTSYSLRNKCHSWLTWEPVWHQKVPSCTAPFTCPHFLTLLS